MTVIKVLKCEDKKTVNGKPYKALEVEVEGEVRKVSMWSFFPNFANVIEGSVFDGIMTKGEKYWDLSFEGAKPASTGQNRVSSPILANQLKVQDTITKNVEKAQDNTSRSVRISSTMRDAVILATTEFKDKTVLDNLDTAVLKWRKFLWTHWEDPDTDPIYPN